MITGGFVWDEILNIVSFLFRRWSLSSGLSAACSCFVKVQSVLSWTEWAALILSAGWVHHWLVSSSSSSALLTSFLCFAAVSASNADQYRVWVTLALQHTACWLLGHAVWVCNRETAAHWYEKLNSVLATETYCIFWTCGHFFGQWTSL